MTNIVPISDLKNYSEVLRACDDGATVYLTKNGRGKYVVQSLAEYEKNKTLAGDADSEINSYDKAKDIYNNYVEKQKKDNIKKIWNDFKETLYDS